MESSRGSSSLDKLFISMRANAAPKQKCTPSRACPRNTTYPILQCNRANSRWQYRSDYRPSIKSLVGDNNTDRRQPASERGKVNRRVTLVRTTLGSENMDSANESGKHAAAAIGQASGLPVPPVPIGTPRYPALLRGLHALGDHRFEAGKRNIFDVFFPLRPAEMLSTKRIHASKLFEPADHSVERADGR
jgi:hypothetical protein